MAGSIWARRALGPHLKPPVAAASTRFPQVKWGPLGGRDARRHRRLPAALRRSTRWSSRSAPSTDREHGTGRPVRSTIQTDTKQERETSMSILQQGAGRPRLVTVQHSALCTGRVCSSGAVPLDVREACKQQDRQARRAVHITAVLGHRYETALGHAGAAPDRDLPSWQPLLAGRGTVRHPQHAGNGTIA